MKRRTQRNLARFFLILFVVGWLACIAACVFVRAMFADTEGIYTRREENAVQAQETAFEAGRLPGDDVPAMTRCFMTDEEVQEDYENEKIEVALLERATKIEDVTITHYCTELYPHICGTGDGVTASGLRVTPYVSVAVDPKVIPLGSDVLVDYGDGELHYYRADDRGAWIKGNHIDVAFTTHDEADQLGRKTATVYWIGADE